MRNESWISLFTILVQCYILLQVNKQTVIHLIIISYMNFIYFIVLY